MEFSGTFGLFSLVNIGITVMVIIQTAIAVKFVIALTKWNSFESNSGLMLFLVLNAFLSGFAYKGGAFLIAPLWNSNWIDFLNKPTYSNFN